MDLQTRKLQFIQEFLRTANSNMLDKFEKLLRQERKKSYDDALNPMTQEEYIHRIEEAVKDYKNNKVSNVRKLKKDIESWNV